MLGANSTQSILTQGIFNSKFAALDQVEDKARKWSLLFMAIGFGALAACIVQSFCFNFMGQRLGKRVRVLMMGALLRQEVGWYDEERNSSGILASKLSADALAVKGQFGDTMGMLTQNLVTLVAGYIIAGIYSWRMMLVVTATVPLLGIAVVIQTRLILQYVSRETETFAAANATAAEAVSSVRTVHAFNMQDSVSQLYHGQLDEPTRQSRKRIMWTGIGFGVSQFIAFGSFSLAFWYAGEEVASGRSSFVDVLKVRLQCCTCFPQYKQRCKFHDITC
jgi:ATP-binding cassette, subfamily B (MDR/TAP), member 1